MATTTNRVEDRNQGTMGANQDALKGQEFKKEGQSFKNESQTFESKNDSSKEFGDKSTGQTESLKDNVKSIIGAKAKNVMDATGVSNWDDVKDKANQALSRGREIAGDVATRVGEGASAAVEQVSTTVRRYPFQAVLVGFGGLGP